MDHPKRRRPSFEAPPRGLVADYHEDEDDDETGVPSAAVASDFRRHPQHAMPSDPTPTVPSVRAEPHNPAAPPVVHQTFLVEARTVPMDHTTVPIHAETASTAATESAVSEVVREAMTDVDSSSTCNVISTADTEDRERFPRLSSLPPLVDEEPPRAVMDKMRQFWAATSVVRAWVVDH